MRLRRFRNLDTIQQHTSVKQFNRWRQERMKRQQKKDYSFTVPSVAPDLNYLHNNRTHPSLTWVGHSTFLIQLAGLNIVTDPVWSGQMAFHKRLSQPGIPIEDVPPVDVVLISHSHYDHLSIQSLRRLGGVKQLIVPAGLGQKLRLKGFTRIHELHWWESVHIHGVKFTFVPSQHCTRRNPWDNNSSHWGGYVMEPYAASGHESMAAAPAEVGTRPVLSEYPTLYFAGDSGYFRGFEEIGRKFELDVALMPIGAYEPEWFMGPQHVTPEQALQAYLDCKAKWFVPMHYGAFKLADDTPREALDRLQSGIQELNIEAERVLVLPQGETWKLSGR
ncbi:MBL fold metallo-hydrolase [Paenibacillus sp. GCM10023252]|uniref:MBL fold metallo-hydrolase n=1 Tax=Paenibacillus sp. GCM10023252 TaxID=3252649 RepID=UPI00360F46D3